MATTESLVAHSEARILAQLKRLEAVAAAIHRWCDQHDRDQANFEALVSNRIDQIEKREQQAQEAHWAAWGDGLLAHVETPW